MDPATPPPPPSGAAEKACGPGVLRLLDVRDRPLSVDECLQAVADPAAGGTALFVGTVREQDGGRRVTALSYSAHPRARAELQRVALAVAAAYPVCGIAAVHRVGDLLIGDLAVVVAVSSPHRGEAFAAARHLIDDLKASVPIWKAQTFADGGSEWVGAPSAAQYEDNTASSRTSA